MIAVFQRVSGAWVEVEGGELSRIGKGALVLVGVESGDTEDDAAYVAEKCGSLRVFDDEKGRLNLSVLDVNGSVLLVSQFTLCADCRKGRRPSFASAARPDEGKRVYELVASKLRVKGVEVKTGRFQSHMGVHLTNDGPVTVIIDSRKRL
jgi:D-tyrosyl-tRNA(Tyr) deacylase